MEKSPFEKSILMSLKISNLEVFKALLNLLKATEVKWNQNAIGDVIVIKQKVFNDPDVDRLAREVCDELTAQKCAIPLRSLQQK